MKLICAPSDFDFASMCGDVDVVLYGQAGSKSRGCAGEAVAEVIRRKKLRPAARAWDLLSIALAVLASDLAGHRDRSPDGWTRDFDVHVAVADPVFWASQAATIEALLRFLTTDIWRVHFLDNGISPAPAKDATDPDEDCVVLLSGGLDSFIGTVDLVAEGKHPFAISHTVRGDAEEQRRLASLIGGGLRHLQLNHNVSVPDPEIVPSQRARSFIFLAYGVLAATSLARYHAGKAVKLYLCENGFISINPPLTSARLGSLSTRTSHPVVLALFQRVLDAAGLRVSVDNPYQLQTKGEMLSKCSDQALLTKYAHSTTSCGRFKRFKYRHCGRCVPCLIRRASFNAWGVPDKTKYVFAKLAKDDVNHARYDDVRAAAMAIAEVKQNGLDAWLGASVSSSLLRDPEALKDVAGRGLAELAAFLRVQKVR